jgi:heme/copper-type cytochrome/quinol oxidase subunit 2
MMAPRGAAVILIVALLAAGGAYYAYSAGGHVVPGASSGSVQVDIHIVAGGTGNLTSETYTPDNFSVKEGQNVTLVIFNTDDSTHGLVITQFGVNSGTIAPHATVRVWFLADQAGVFEFYEPAGYCEAGMGSVCNGSQHLLGYMTVRPA